MNEEFDSNIRIKFAGTLEITRDQLAVMLNQIPPCRAQAAAPPVRLDPDNLGALPRMAFSINETAELLGLSTKTVYRLIARGLLKSSIGLRRKLIPKKEIDRFLEETSP